MKITTKGKYAIAAMIFLAERNNDNGAIPLPLISKQLGISKIYLEQIFSSLKRNHLVTSVKGPQGGYVIKQNPKNITILSVLIAVESKLLEQDNSVTLNRYKEITLMINDLILNKLNLLIDNFLSHITLSDLMSKIDDYKSDNESMYYI